MLTVKKKRLATIVKGKSLEESLECDVKKKDFTLTCDMPRVIGTTV